MRGGCPGSAWDAQDELQKGRGRMKRLGLLGWLLLSVLGPWSSGQAAELPPVAVTFERPVHFLREDGDSVAVDAATYLVERNGLTLRLMPEKGGEAIALPVEELSVDLPV